MVKKESRRPHAKVLLYVQMKLRSFESSAVKLNGVRRDHVNDKIDLCRRIIEKIEAAEMDAIAYIQRESNTLLHRKLINLSEQLLSRRQCYRLLSNDDFDLSNINDESRAELSEIVTQLADQITNRKEKYAVGVRYVDENEVA